MAELKQRHGCVSVWLWLVIIANLIFAIVYLVDIFSSTTQGTDILFEGGLSALSLIMVLAAILLMRWNKCGFWLFIMGSLVSGILSSTSLQLGVAGGLGTVIGCLIAVLIWYGILQITKDGVSAWSQLEGGWDYAHCRHLYQFFGVIVVVILGITIFRYASTSGSSTADTDVVEDTLAVGPDEKDVPDIVWKTFYGAKHSCSLEAPDDFRPTNFSEDQTLGLSCTTYDPSVVVIRETAQSLKENGITNVKSYSDVVVKMMANTDGSKDFNKISQDNYGDKSYLVVFDRTIDDTASRFYILTTRTNKYFYYCAVTCEKKYVKKQELTIKHMISTFKVNE